MTGRRSRRDFLAAVGTTAGVTVAGCQGVLQGNQEAFDEAYDPPALMLTWQDDPTSTMTIDWHTEGEEERDPDLDYRRRGEEEWTRVSGETHDVEHEDPNTGFERDIQRVALTGLDPDTAYEFRVGTDPVWSFRTMPETLEEPLTFATGGDTGHIIWDSVLEATMAHDPEFLVICGDMPIGDGGVASNAERNWESWFDSVTEYLVDDDGRVVPVVAGIGNHECREGYYYDARREFERTDEWREWHAPYFYSFFAFPGHPGYGVLDFGDYMSIPMLDSNHTNPIDGKQAEWLEGVLSERENVTHVFPHYHVPIWPAPDPQSNEVPPNHTHWLSSFGDHGIDFAFEHHRHRYKRTVPIREESPDENGVVYIGDGNMGQLSPNAVDDTRWYLERAEVTYNVRIMTIDGTSARLRAIDDEGETIDEFEREAGGTVAVDGTPEGDGGY